MFEKKHYAYCLFFCHLAVEKELKRLYLLHKKEVPPFIHNLVRIAEEADLAFSEDLWQDLKKLTTFNIKARYEIIKDAFHKRATKSYSQKWLNKTEQILTFLKKIE